MLSCSMQECLGLSIKTKLSYFIINHEKINYIVIVFNTENLIINETNILKKMRIKLPPTNERVYLNSDVILSIASMQSINLHHLPTNPSVLYIYANVLSGTIIKSMSGSAIYDNNNRLVGILSKTHEINGHVFAVIIPAYYLYKTFSKLNNNAIYNLNSTNTGGVYGIRINLNTYTVPRRILIANNSIANLTNSLSQV